MKKAYRIILAIAVAAFVASGAYLAQDFLISKEDQDNLDEIIALTRLPVSQPPDAREEEERPKAKVAVVSGDAESAGANAVKDELGELLQTMADESLLSGVPIETITLEILPGSAADENIADDGVTEKNAVGEGGAPGGDMAGDGAEGASTDPSSEEGDRPERTEPESQPLLPGASSGEEDDPEAGRKSSASGTLPEGAASAEPDHSLSRPVSSAPPEGAEATPSIRLTINGKAAEAALDAGQIEEITKRLEAYVRDHRAAFASAEIAPITFAVEKEPAPILPQYRLPAEQNTDMVGWIEIAGTKVNAPVMQTPQDPEFYLGKNFEKEDSRSGLPFLDARCDLERKNDNLLIYGHHMKGGEMFAQILRYESRSFYRNHPTFRLDLLRETRTYQVIAVFQTRQFEEGYTGFEYYDYIDLSGKNRFDEYITQAKRASYYDTGVPVAWGDQIATLSTCSYGVRDGRFVVIAKRVG